MSAQGSEKTAIGRPFQKGGDPRRNAGGRPKGLEKLVAARTHNGADLVNFYADVLHRTGEFEGARIPLAMRAQAVDWLADRLWGKPKQMQEVTGPNGGDIPISVTAVRELVASRIIELAPAVRDRLALITPGPDPGSSEETAA